VKVQVMDVLVEHTVMFVDFMKWLVKENNNPVEGEQRERVRKILSLG